jgi:hypothetical protein
LSELAHSLADSGIRRENWMEITDIVGCVTKTLSIDQNMKPVFLISAFAHNEELRRDAPTPRAALLL